MGHNNRLSKAITIVRSCFPVRCQHLEYSWIKTQRICKSLQCKTCILLLKGKGINEDNKRNYCIDIYFWLQK